MSLAWNNEIGNRGKSPWKRDIKIRETRRNKITGVSRIMKSRCDRKFEALIKHRPLFVHVYQLQKTRYNRILLYPAIYIYIQERIEFAFHRGKFHSMLRILISFIPLDFYFIFFFFLDIAIVKLIFDTFEWRIKSRRYTENRSYTERGYLKLCKSEANDRAVPA